MDERWSQLAVKAYERGLIDYSKYRRNDPQCIMKERILFRQMEMDIWKDLLGIRFLQSTILGVSNAPEFAKHNIEASIRLSSRLMEYHVPWVEWGDEAEAQSLAEVYQDWVKAQSLPETRERQQQIREAVFAQIEERERKEFDYQKQLEDLKAHRIKMQESMYTTPIQKKRGINRV